MSTLNQAQIIGNLGKDPETKSFDGGSQVTNITVASSEKYKNRSGETVEETEWHNVQMWGKLSEIASRYLKKGDKVFIQGKLKTRSWEDQSGQKKYITEIRADMLKMLSLKRDSQRTPVSGAQSTPASSSPQQPMFNDPDDDDLPF